MPLLLLIPWQTLLAPQDCLVLVLPLSPVAVSHESALLTALADHPCPAQYWYCPLALSRCATEARDAARARDAASRASSQPRCRRRSSFLRRTISRYSLLRYSSMEYCACEVVRKPSYAPYDMDSLLRFTCF